MLVDVRGVIDAPALAVILYVPAMLMAGSEKTTTPFWPWLRSLMIRN